MSMTETPAPAEAPEAPEVVPEVEPIEPTEPDAPVTEPPDTGDPAPPDEAGEPESLVDAAAIARLLDTSERWVLAQANAGNLPGYVIGSRFRFRTSEVLAWVDARRVGEAS